MNRQGPWTDVYGAAATLYFMLTARRLPSALERKQSDLLRQPDPLQPARHWIPDVPLVLDAALRALAVEPDQRFQSMVEFKRPLEAVLTVEEPTRPLPPQPTATPEPPTRPPEPKVAPEPPKPKPAPEPPKPKPAPEPPKAPPKPNAVPERSTPPKRRTVVVALAVIGLGGWLWWKFGISPPPVPSVVVAPSVVTPPVVESPPARVEPESTSTPVVADHPASKPRPAENLIADRYRDNGDGTVTDARTVSQWMRCSFGQTWRDATCSGEAKEYLWQAALDAVKSLNRQGGYAGYRDWRVPTIEGLRTLVYCSSSQPKTWNDTGKPCEGDYEFPTLYQPAFPNTQPTLYWSSSPYTSGAGGAWYVVFYAGGAYAYDSGNYFGAVRLVCGGQ